MVSLVEVTWSLDSIVSYTSVRGEASIQSGEFTTYLRVWTETIGAFEIPLDPVMAEYWGERTDVLVTRGVNEDGELLIRVRKIR